MQQPKAPSTVLPEDKRQQLDSNIKKMLEGGATIDQVKLYSTDFNKKFSVKKKGDTSEVTAPEPSLESSGDQPTASSATQEVENPIEKPNTSKSPISDIMPYWQSGDIKKMSSAETIASYENFKAQSNLTPEEQQEVDSEYKRQQEGDFGTIDNITNWFRKKDSFLNPFYNPDAVTKPKTKEELVKEKVSRKRKDFLNTLDDPEKRKKIETLVKVDNWQEDEKRVVVDRKITKGVELLNELDQQVEPLLLRKKELESIELGPNVPDNELKAFQQEYKEVTNALTQIQDQGKKAFADYEQSMQEYSNHTDNIGRFEDELSMLKRDYQFSSNAKNILGLGFAEIASDLKYQFERSKFREDRQSLQSVLQAGLQNDPKYKDMVPAEYLVDGFEYNPETFDAETEKLKESLIGSSLTDKDVLGKQRDFLTPTVTADDIEGIGDFIDFATNGILETTPTLIQLGLPYVGQTSFFASQQANSELNLRKSILDDKKELKEINEALNNSENNNLSDEQTIAFAKRKKQLEQQDQPSEANILVGSTAMAASELLLGRLGKIRLINKAKRTAQTINQNTLTNGIKESFKKRLLKETIDFGKDVAGEGAEEFGVGVVGNIADIYLLDRKFNSDGTRKNILDGSYGNILGGLSTGGALSGSTKVTGYVAREVSDFKRRKAVVENVKQIETLTKNLSDPNLSPELRKSTELQISALNKKNGLIIKNVVDVFNGLSKEDNAKIIEINNQISAKEIALEELAKKGQSDSDLSKSIQGQINALDGVKSEILDTNTKVDNSVLSILPEALQLKYKDEASKAIEDQYKKDGVEDYTITDSEITAKAEEIINAKETDEKLNTPDDNLVPPSENNPNEAQTQGDIIPDADVRSESGNDVQQGQDSTTQPTVEPTTSKGEVEVTPKTTTKKVKSLKGAEYDVTFDESGSVTKIISPKDGREISKFREVTDKKTGKKKLQKNGNYSRIVADATGGITENQAREQRTEKVSKAIDSYVPTDAYGHALKAIASGSRVSSESASKETGLTKFEVKYVTGFKPDNELPSIENLAEKIVENSEQELDVQDVRDALIDIISSNNSTLDIEDALVSSMESDQTIQQEQELYEYKNSLSEKDLTLLESIEAEDTYISELTDLEATEYYEGQYGTQSTQNDQIGATETSSVQERTGKQESKTEDTKEGVVDDIISKLESLKKEVDYSAKVSLGINIPQAVLSPALAITIQSLKAGKALAKAIQDGIAHIKSTDWYKRLSKSEKKEAVSDFEKQMVQGTNTPEQNKEYVEDVFDANDAEINKKKPVSTRFRETLRKVIQKYSDRQFIAKILLDRTGMQSVKDLMINGHGSSGKAKRMFDKAYEDIYADQITLKGGKVEVRAINQADRKLLDKIIMLKRFIAIDKHRKDNNLPPVTHPGFINGRVSQDALDQYKDEVGDKKFQDLEKRSKAYFDVYGKVLKDMYDNGLISKESYDSLNGVDYQPRQFLQHITDFEGNVSLGGAIKGVKDTGGLAKDQINSLKEGSEGALIRDSEWLLSTTIAGRYKAIAMNNVNKKFIQDAFPKAKKRFQELKKKPKKEWTKEDKRFAEYFKELNSKIKDNPVININENGTAERVFDKTPPNFKKAYYYENGVRNEFFIEENLHDSWFDNIDGFLSSDSKSIIQSASGSSLLKAIATGNNPTFPIVNTPRDFAFLTIFSTQYSSFLPLAMLQAGKDSVKAVKEIFVSNKKNVSPENLFNKYIEYGGDMSFLSKQGRIKEGTTINKTLNKIFGPRFKHIGGKIFSAVTLQKISTYSEMMFRIALMDRAIKNELKSRGYKDIKDVTEKSEVDEIYNRAVADARSILDFNQGGTITKDMESVIPYLNTAVQGTRVMADAITKDPEKVIFKMAQAGIMFSGFTMGTSLMLISLLRDSEDEEDKELTAVQIYLKAQQGLSAYQRIQYMNIVTGVKDEDGEYQVLKIAKTQPMAPLLSLTDNVTNHLAATMAGVDKKDTSVSYSEIGTAINNNLAPIDISFLGALLTEKSFVDGLANSVSGTITRNPLGKSALTYATGYDFYRQKDLTYDTDKDDPAMDGANDKNIEDFYKKFGRANSISPARLKGGVEALITTPSTNPFVGMLYGGADYITASDGELKDHAAEFWKTMKRSTTKRVIGYTSPFNREVNKMAPFESEITRKARENKYDIIDMKNDVRQAWDDEITTKELVEKISNYDENVRKKMANELKKLAKKQDVPRYVMSLKFESDKEVRAMRILYYYGDIDDPTFKGTEDFSKMKELGILDKETMSYYLPMLEEMQKKNK